MPVSKRFYKVQESYKPVAALSNALGIMFLDQEISMPQKGTEKRAKTFGEMGVLLRKSVLNLRKDVKGLNGRDEIEQGILKEIRAEITYWEQINEKVAREMGQLHCKATVAWREAKKESNFSKMRPYYERIVEIQQEIGKGLKDYERPYEALLSTYEYGMTVRELDGIFKKILPALTRIQKKTHMPTSHKLETMEYDKDSMKNMTFAIQKMLNIPEDIFRIDISAHPFAMPLDIQDIRITTNLHNVNPKISLLDSIHEIGHAIDGFQLSPKLRDSAAGESASYGLAESQSRFWEVMVGQSRSFANVLQPLFKKYLNINESPEEIYKYFNVVKFDSARIGASELTFEKHIAMRYEIEKGLISGKMVVADLPAIWEDYMETYLGVRPKNDGEGVLQDMHWADGSFGYFPTYTLGNIVASMIRKEIKNLDELIETQRFDLIKEWLGENINRHGAVYNPKDLLKKVFRRTYDTKTYIDYLEDKYLVEPEDSPGAIFA